MDSPKPTAFPEQDWSLEFCEVEFAHEHQQSGLKIPSLRIWSGEQVAIVGHNGAGKSTLAKLIARLYDVDSGSIQIGGVDIRQVQLQSLRRNVCYTARDPVLFDGSFASNLNIVRPGIPDHELNATMNIVGLNGLIGSLPSGLHQRIGPDGCQLSGGERQRLALARALLQNPRVLILDEATSCLDVESEARILQNLRKQLTRTTLLVVSHRTSTLSSFARILVLSEGCIVEDWRPELATDGRATSAPIFVVNAETPYEASRYAKRDLRP